MPLQQLPQKQRSTRARSSSNNRAPVVRNTQPAPVPQNYSSGHPARFVALVGVAFVVFFVLAIMMQVETNEALITHQGIVNIYRPNWAILWQPVELVMGGLSATDAAASMFGWGIELVYLGFIVGYEMLQDSVAASGLMMSRIFLTLSWGIVLFNAWADFNYGFIASNDFGGHLLFALMMSFIVGFFGTIGMFLIRHGWSQA